MVSRDGLLQRLKAIVGDANVSVALTDRKLYAYPVGASGDFIDGPPDYVVLPSSTQQVSDVVRLANENRVPVIPRGAGTNQAGSNVAPFGGIMLDMSLMDKILEINEDDMVVVAEGGCSVYNIMFQLDQRGLAFPVAPLYTSAPQIGAGVACNITGCYMSRFGRLGDNLTGLEVVLPTGEIVTLGSGAYQPGYGFFHRYVGGPDLLGLFINAGGTTGVITKVAVRVKPKPAFQATLAYGWKRDEVQRLTDGMVELHKEFVYDLLLLNEWNFFMGGKMGKVKLPPGTHFVALLSVDARDEGELKRNMDETRALCERHGGNDLGDIGKHAMGGPEYRIWASVSPWMQRIHYPFYYSPVRKFPEIYDVFEQSCRKHDIWNEKYIPSWFSFHCRNAMNPYPTLGITNPMDKAEVGKIKAWWDDFNGQLAVLGCPQYLMGDAFPIAAFERLGPAYDLMKKIKGLLDPNDIMNPSRTYGGTTHELG